MSTPYKIPEQKHVANHVKQEVKKSCPFLIKWENIYVVASITLTAQSVSILSLLRCLHHGEMNLNTVGVGRGLRRRGEKALPAKKEVITLEQVYRRSHTFN